MFWMTLAMAAPDEGQIREVAEVAGLSVAEVRERLAGVERDDSVLERMARPWEAKPWHAYRRLFLTPERIEAGREFYATHQALFERASAETGVEPAILLAILGVETSYGTRMGDDPVVTALYTLGFHHPRRGRFFRSELGHFLRLAADEGWEVKGPRGSYAGAMGYGQFMPSSYRAYAVDFDADGDIDLFTSPADAIGSVANYFAEHGWHSGEPVLRAASGRGLDGWVSKGLELNTTVGALRAAGVQLDGTDLAEGAGARVFAFETEAGPEYQVGLHNFFVITRYNRSPLYARAVLELAEAFALSSPPGKSSPPR